MDTEEVFVQPFPGLDGKWQISTGGGYEAIWGSQRQEIYYRWGNQVLAASIDTDRGVPVTETRVLFAGDYFFDSTNRPSYDVSPDGERFLMIKNLDGDATSFSKETSLAVVENWFEELNRLAPSAE